ncbi:MAG: exopolysaccharide regulatory tyrosine autokinase VpsO [Rhodothermia bacterium]|nr:MAG: exopolysaccharide regulatory tyrosine autokinase VpsO [Rhodothermia bacterium]
MRKHETHSRSVGPRLIPVESGSMPEFAPEQVEQSRLSFLDYWRIARRYKWSILMFALIAGVIGTLNALSTTSFYQANARLWIKINQPNISNVQQFEAASLNWLFFQTQSDIIASQAVAERVVSRLGLRESYSQPSTQNAGSEVKRRLSVSARVNELINELKSWLPEELRPPRPKPLDAAGRRAAFVNGVLSGVSVSGGKESEILVISYTSAEPEMAAKMANAFAETYIEYSLESRTSNVQQATSWLGGRIEELRNKAVASENILRDFRAREGLVDTEQREKIISAKLGTLTAELIRARSRRSEAEARYDQFRSVLNNDSNYEAVASAMNSAIVVETYRQKVRQEQRVAELSERYGYKHPKMISAKAELQEANRRLKVELGKAVDGARKELELATAQERQFRKMISQQQSDMQGVSGKAFEMRQLEREVEANRRLYETFLARFKESDVAGEYDVPNARIIDRAIVPTTPFTPNRKRMVFISVILGLGIGTLIAFLRDHLSNTFKTKEDVEERLNLPVIGVLPRLKTGRSSNSQVERLVLGDPRSPFSEVINDIRTAILFSHIDTPSKVVLVTSAVPGEGKTTLVSNLALAFSRRGRTLLIDADLRNGRFQQITDMKNHLGLTDMLSGGCTRKEAVVQDPEASNLFILMTGTAPPNPLEIVASKRFSDELTRLRDIFDYIVIDGTPLLPVSDSVVLARLVDATVLTVRTDDTTCDATLDALKRLRAARVEPVGVVMQQVDMRKLRSYGRRYMSSYSGYYGYRGSGG